VVIRRKILVEYATSWMPVDLLAVLPYEYMTPGNGSSQAAQGASLTKVFVPPRASSLPRPIFLLTPDCALFYRV
jgi:hypothetical protein